MDILIGGIESITIKTKFIRKGGNKFYYYY